MLNIPMQNREVASENPPTRSRLIDCCHLVRPVNLVITALSVVIAGVISVPDVYVRFPILFFAAFSAALIAAGGNAFNDYCDRELDRHQKPHRPIPAGKVSPGAALMITFVCLLAGLALAIALGGTMILIASWAVFLLLFYNWKWKRTPLIGNLCVAFTAALAFVYGGVAVQAVEVAIWAAILAFLFHLGREIVKDMEDYPGDKAAAAGTLAVRFGLAAAGSAATVTFLGLVTFLILPWLLGPFDQLYLLVVLAGVLPVLLLAILWLWKWQEPRQLHRLNVLLKADMVVGLAALLVGSPGVKTWFL